MFDEREIQLDDLVGEYPEITDREIQKKIAGKFEFLEIEPESNESAPARGQMYRHQELIKRIMLTFGDRILLKHDPGMGKTCTIFSIAEYYKLRNQLLLPESKDKFLERAIIVVKGATLVDEFKFQLTCKCTPGQYETDIVRRATDPRIRKRNLTLEIKKFYDIKTYYAFSHELGKLNDDQIRKYYSNRLIVFDEIHYICMNLEFPPDEQDSENEFRRGLASKKDSQLRDVYVQMKRLIDNTEETKIILLTATPMLATPKEMKAVMDLILPKELKYPDHPDEYYDTQTSEQLFEELEHYFRGRVSYVKRFKAQAIPEYIGITGTIARDARTGEERELRTVIEHVQMGIYQTFGYINIYLENQRQWWNRELNSSLFVFPGFSSGQKGFDEYIIETVGNYHFSQEFWTNFDQITNTERDESIEHRLGFQTINPALFNGEADVNYEKNVRHFICQLYNFSGKYAKILALIHQSYREKKKGTIFVYNNKVHGSGSIILGLLIEHIGYENFKEKKIFTNEKATVEETPRDPSEEAPEKDIEFTEFQFESSVCPGEEKRKLAFGKKPRYAVLTSETMSSIGQQAIKTFNSHQNLHGEYLKVIIGSDVSRDGLNLSHCTDIIIATPSWNPSETLQALSRGIRANSHDDLLEEAQRIDGPQATVKINVHLLANNPHLPKSGEAMRSFIENYRRFVGRDISREQVMGIPSVDDFIYMRSEVKDIRIRKIDRVIKRSAVDCLLMRRHNLELDLPPDEAKDLVDYSAECDYEKCDYVCANPEKPHFIDESTFYAYFSEELVKELKSRIVDVFKLNNALSLEKLVHHFAFDPQIFKSASQLLDDRHRLSESVAPLLVRRAVIELSSERTTIENKIGMGCYLIYDRDMVYLQSSYPEFSVNDSTSTLYADRISAVEDVKLEKFLQEIQVKVEINYDEEYAKFEGILPNSLDFYQLMASDKIHTVLLYEDSFLKTLNHRNTSINDNITSYFRFQSMTGKYDLSDLNMITNESSNPRKGKGRPATSEETKEKGIREKIAAMTFTETGEDVYVNWIGGGKITGRTGYNITASNFKIFEKDFRILRTSELDKGWRDATSVEKRYYVRYGEVHITNMIIGMVKHCSEIAVQQQQQEIGPDEQIYYGTWIDGEFRIAHAASSEISSFKTLHSSFIAKGKNCMTHSIEELSAVLQFYRIAPGFNPLQSDNVIPLWERFGKKERCPTLKLFFIANNMTVVF